MEEMFDAVMAALGSGWLLLVYGIALVLGFFLLKGKRKLFLLPAVVMTIVVLNPLTKTVWEKINDYAYWRLLWMLPLIPVIAAVPSAVVEKTKKWYGKLVTVLLAAGIVVLSGYFIYNNDVTTFKMAKNADKLPQEVTEVAEALLELDDNPRIVADQYIATYIREYSGKIKTPYGRDLVFGEPDQYALDAFQYLTNMDMKNLLEHMKARNYQYLVTYNLGPERYVRIEKAGFEYIWQAGEYGIYAIN